MAEEPEECQNCGRRLESGAQYCDRCGEPVKYRGDKPRGFTVLTARPKTGRAVAGEFNSPRPSRDGSAGIHTRTPGASVRVGGSTPPDNTRLTTPKTWVLRGVAFPNHLSQRWIKIFNPSLWVSDCTNCTNRGLLNLSTGFTLWVKWFERRRLSSSRKTPSSVRPRGTRPVPPVEAVNAGVTSYLQTGGSEQYQRLANRIEQAAEKHRTEIRSGRYAAVLRALGYPMYVVDENATFEYVNEAFAELTGYDREEIIGSPPGLIKTDSGVEQANDTLRSVVSSAGPNTAQFEVEIQIKAGGSVPCQDHSGYSAEANRL